MTHVSQTTMLNVALFQYVNEKCMKHQSNPQKNMYSMFLIMCNLMSKLKPV